MNISFKRLRNKFLVFNLALTMLILVGTLISVYLMTSYYIENENRTRLYGISFESNGSLETTSFSETDQEITNTIINPFISFTLVINSSGDIEYQGSAIQASPDFYEEAAKIALSHSEASSMRLAGKDLMYHIVPEGETGSYLIDFMDVTDSQLTLHYLAITLSSVGMISFVAIFFVSLFYANRSIEPISTMWDAQKKFVTNASHELKTPLAVIKANCHVLAANKDETIQSQEEWLNHIEYGIDRMTDLINRLLVLAKGEDSEIRVQKKEFSISELANQMVASLKAAAVNKEVTFISNIEPGVELVSDKDAIAQILEILMENAVKYVNTGGNVTFDLIKEADQIIVSVENSGQGIETKHFSKIFERFYRIDNDQVSEEEGFGLGLSIVKSLLEKLNGEIQVESKIDEFTKFTVTLNN